MTKLGASAEIIIAAQTLPGVIDCGEDETDIYLSVKRAIRKFDKVCTQEVLAKVRPFLCYISMLDKTYREDRMPVDLCCHICANNYITFVNSTGILCSGCRKQFQALVDELGE